MGDTGSVPTGETWLLKTPKRFYLLRRDDPSGVSGKGVVAWGVMWEDGTASMRWCVDGKPKSTTDYLLWEDVEEIHGHEGSTEVVFIDYPHTRIHNGIPV